MLGEESKVDTYEHDPKVDFCSCAVKGVSWEKWESVYESSYNGEYSSYWEDIVEVSNYIVGVVQDDV